MAEIETTCSCGECEDCTWATCDLCGEREDRDALDGAAHDWNGETGCHRSCEESAS